MYFNEVIGLKEVDKEEKVFYRVAIRAVILKEDKILMVKSNTGDYKFLEVELNRVKVQRKL